MTNKGVTEVHLFISAPMPLAAKLGSLFDNWCTVKVYHFNNGRYEYWTTLKKEVMVDISDILAEEI